LNEDIKENSADGYKAQLLATILFFDLFGDILIKDAAFALFSVCFVYIYLAFHLKSCFLASVGITLILCSFPFTVVITEGIFQVTYFSSLQVIAIYIVLGIAADDIFVFYDAWRQSKNIAPDIINDKHRRMAYAWRRAVKAMAVTSTTTAVAFFANAFSPLMPIRSFGIFSGVIIPLNYFLVVMMMPSAAIIYEKYKFKTWCCCPCGLRSEAEIEENSKPEVGKLGTIEKFFDEKVNKVVHKGRYVIIGLALVWFVVTAIFAVKMGPMTEAEDFIDPDHPIMQPIKIITNEFGVKESAGTPISVYWGVSGVNQADGDIWDPTWVNAPIFDTTLDISPTKNQKWLKDFCTGLVAEKFTLAKGQKCWIN